MLRIVICDDEALHRERAAELVRTTLLEYQPEIDCYGSAASLISALSMGDYAPDIAILDIQMDGMDGIALAKRLNELAPECRIIFLTSYLNFATNVYDTRHTYFVLKSQLAERIFPALRKAISALADDEPCIHFKNGASAKIIPVRDVLYMERRLHKTRIAMNGGEAFTKSAPRELTEVLPPGRFIHCHQSFWVNRSAISTMEKNEFVLSNGERLPISRTFRQDARNAFLGTLFAVKD
jgi:DNA-binding LytR/AlgR family response regulator